MLGKDQHLQTLPQLPLDPQSTSKFHDTHAGQTDSKFQRTLQDWPSLCQYLQDQAKIGQASQGEAVRRQPKHFLTHISPVQALTITAELTGVAKKLESSFKRNHITTNVSKRPVNQYM